MNLQSNSFHPQYRVHTVAGADLTSIQRIVGLPLSWVEPTPAFHATDDVALGDRRGTLLFDEPTWAAKDDDRTPLDKPVPDGITQDDYNVPPLAKDDYDGFPSDAGWADQGHVGVHDELEQAADDFLASADEIRDCGDLTLRSWLHHAGVKVERRPMRVPGLKPVWDTDAADDSRAGWTYKPHTYTLGFKRCPRCNGTPHRFAERSCTYCKAQGGWRITRTRMTPVHPEYGIQLTPPRTDDKPVHTTHWRVRGEYYGDARIKKSGRPSEAVMAEIRRRHFATTTARELRKLAVADYAASTSAQLIAA